MGQVINRLQAFLQRFFRIQKKGRISFRKGIEEKGFRGDKEIREVILFLNLTRHLFEKKSNIYEIS